MQSKFFTAFLLLLTISTNFESRVQAAPLSQSACATFIKTKLPFYLKLYRLLIQHQPQHRNPEIEEILSSNVTVCRSGKFDPSLLTDNHSGKIGLILPLTGIDGGIGRQFESAIKSFFASKPEAFDRTVVTLDSRSSKDFFHRALAELVYVHKVAMFVGGATLEEAKFLRIWAESLHTTSFIMHERWFDKTPIATNHSFFISPHQKEMAQSLATYMFGRGLKEYAILYPKEKSRTFIKALQDYGKRLGLPPPVKVVTYDTGNFSSLDASIKHLFEIDNLKDRGDELLRLIKERNAQSDEKHSGLSDPTTLTRLGELSEEKDIILPPIVKFKGLVVPDHFKAIRHIVSILKYYKVPQITLLGQQQWRAQELVEPVDPYLNGSVFVDYMDRYNRLPYKLRVSTDEDGFFTSPSEVGAIDYWLIARHSIQSAVRGLRQLPKDRSKISAHYKSQSIGSAAPYFGSKAMFNSENSSHWPNFIYSISGGKLFSLFKRPSHSHRLLTTRQN